MPIRDGSRGPEGRERTPRRLELDPNIVQRALAGDRESFQSLVHETWGIVFHFVQQRVHDAEFARDLTQDALLQAWDKRATLRQGSSFVSWLLTIAARRIIDSHRRRSTRPESKLPEAPIADPGEAPTRGVERQEDQNQVQQALARLDDRYRAVLILRYWKGLMPAEIAKLLDEPEGTIRNRIFRAHAQLRRHLEGFVEAGRDVGMMTTGKTPAEPQNDE